MVTMRPMWLIGLICCAFAAGIFVSAAIFGIVRVAVHDSQNLVVQNAEVEVRSNTSEWVQTAVTNERGEIQFDTVPLGEYTITVIAEGFAPSQQPLEVTSDTLRILPFQLSVAAAQESVEVSAAPLIINPESSTTQSLVSRASITDTPGADRSNSLAMITDNVPGAYMMHDHLHVRGGHEMTWQVDGVPVPNTNVASVGSQFDPKDIDYLEIQRGGFSAEYGDRAYGVFNVLPRTGFEGDRFGEFSTSFGSFNRTDNYLSLGSHTDRFAYYGSLNGYRTDLGLETSTPEVVHDRANGLGGFGSLVFQKDPRDQLRLVTSLHRDHFQVPNAPEQQESGIRDVENLTEDFVNFSWVRTPSPGLLLTVSPFYHFNRSHLIGGPNNPELASEHNRASSYVGGHVALAWTKERNNLRAGYDGFAQRDNSFFGIRATDGRDLAIEQRQILWGGVNTLFFEDQFKLAPWLTLNGGLRYTHHSGTDPDNAVSPRIGAAIRIPKLAWTLRGFYGRYYQPPPVSTISGPVEEFALTEGFDFLPLKGERDEQWEVGLAIPVQGWSLDFNYFHTRARNLFDHSVIGNSNIFFPLTIETARIKGLESTLHSPLIARMMQFHWAFSHQMAEGRGGVSGGLTNFKAPVGEWFFLDHDQRYTVSVGLDANLPWKASASTDILYGSGYLRGNGPDHMSPHTTVDLSLKKDVGESWSVSLTALNIVNRRYLLGLSNSFAGTHYAHPREISVQVRHRFHF